MLHYVKSSGKNDLSASLLPSAGVSTESKHLKKPRSPLPGGQGKSLGPCCSLQMAGGECSAHPTASRQPPAGICISVPCPPPRPMGAFTSFHAGLSPPYETASLALLSLSCAPCYRCPSPAAPKPRPQASHCSASISEQMPHFLLQGWKHLMW